MDDIDFDEEELEGERNREQDQRERQQQQQQQSGTDDVDMGGVTSTDRLDESYNEAAGPSSPTRISGAAAQLAHSPAPGTTPVPAAHAADAASAAPRRRMKITHDRYQQIQSLVVYHIKEREDQLQQGIDRDELIDWYLETREDDVQSVDELDYEKELFQKVLKRLVKVSFLVDDSVVNKNRILSCFSF